MAQITMTIGQLAKAAGVNVETIRYYQRIGLLSVSAKPYGSQRRYGEGDLKRVLFIRRAQGLGFSLEEIRLLLDFAHSAPCAETKRIAQKKLTVVEKKLAGLNAIRTTLVKLIGACESGGPGNGCPIIECLGGTGEREDGEDS